MILLLVAVQAAISEVRSLTVVVASWVWQVFAGEPRNAAEAVRPVEVLHPDLVLLDLRLGEYYGTEVCREIKAQVPEAPCVLVFLAHTSVEGVAETILVGADGDLQKGVTGEQLLDAIWHTYTVARVWPLPAENEETAATRVGKTSDKARLRPKEVYSSSSSTARTPGSPRTCERGRARRVSLVSRSAHLAHLYKGPLPLSITRLRVPWDKS